MKNCNYDSYCGIYCGACDIMMAGRTGGKYRLASFWNGKNIRRYQKTIGIEYDSKQPVTFKCDGCKSGTLFANCASCQIRKCAIDRKVDYCLDCILYPCTLIDGFNKVGSLLPHIRNNQDNMERIKESGIKKWLSEQEERWRCPDCKTEFSWYTNKCKKCGKNLTESSYKFSFLQALILKLGIFIASRKAEQRQIRNKGLS